MKQTLFNQGWLTWQETDAFSMVWNIPAGAKSVTLPHDAMLEHPAHAESPNGGNTGYRDGGVYVYCKRFHVPVEWREKTILLRFEGSYCNTFVYLNGQLAADHPNGYTGFTVSLNGFCSMAMKTNCGYLFVMRLQAAAGIPAAGCIGMCIC